VDDPSLQCPLNTEQQTVRNLHEWFFLYQMQSV